MLLASRYGRGGGRTSQLVAANRVHVFFNDHASLLQRLDQCVAGSPVWVASHFWTPDCPTLVGALEHAGLILSLRASAVFGVPEIHRSSLVSTSAVPVPCEVHESKLTLIAQKFVRHCFLRLSSASGNEGRGSATVAHWAEEDQMVERLAALVAQERVRQLAAALGYTGKSRDMMQCVERLVVTSVTKVTRPLKLRVRGDLEAKGSETQETLEANAQLGDGRCASGRAARSGACFACGEAAATCACLNLEDHLEWAVEWGAAGSADGKAAATSRHAAMPVTVFLSRAAVLGELGERSQAMYPDLAPLQLQGLDLLVAALTSILSADGNPFCDGAAEQSVTEIMSESAGAGRFGGGCHEFSKKNASESTSGTGAPGKSRAVEAEARQQNVQGQDGLDETQTSLLAQLVREMMSLGEEDLKDPARSSTVPGSHASSSSTPLATAAAPMPPPTSFAGNTAGNTAERALLEDKADAGLQRQEAGTARDGVWDSESWDSESSLQQAGAEGGKSAGTAGSLHPIMPITCSHAHVNSAHDDTCI